MISLKRKQRLWMVTEYAVTSRVATELLAELGDRIDRISIDALRTLLKDAELKAADKRGRRKIVARASFNEPTRRRA